MHYCIISFQTHISGAFGGVSTHVAELSNLLISLGHEVTVICPSHKHHFNIDYIEVVNEISYYCIGNTSSQILNSSWKLKCRDVFMRLNESIRFRAVFLEGIASKFVVQEIIDHRIPCFAFLHNFGITHIYNVFKEIDTLKSFLYYCFRTVPRLIHKIISVESPAFNLCTLVLSACNHNVKRVRKFYGVNEGRIKVIPNWVDTEKFAPSSQLRVRGRRRWQCQENELIFALVGSLYRPKGFHFAIKSFSDFINRHNDACLLIAGIGRQEKQLKDLAQKLGLIEGKNIKFLGEVKHTLLPLLYNAADILLVPSLLIEVLPYSLLEAMSCELPFIATTNAGCMEAAGNVGILIPSANVNAMTDAMFYLAQNKEERTQIGRLARARVINQFSQRVAKDKINLILRSFS